MSTNNPENSTRFNDDGASQAPSGQALATPGKPETLIRIDTVSKMTGLGRSSIYAIPGFPPRVVLSRRAVGWKLSEIQRWIDSRASVGA